MTGELWNEHAPLLGEPRSNVDPVSGAPTEAMDKHKRRSLGGPTDEVAKPGALRLGETLLEARNRLCVRHADKLFFARWITWEGGNFDSCRQDNRSGSLSPSTREREAGFLLDPKEDP